MSTITRPLSSTTASSSLRQFDVSRDLNSVADLVRKGRELEKVVLARAVDFHLRSRIVVYGNKTVVFD